MITSLYVAGAVDSFSGTLELDTLTYPLQKFAWEYATVGDRPARHQQAGSWDAPKFVEYMSITMEGEILASTTSAYWTARKALLQKIIPPRANTLYNHVKFLLTVDGDAEVYYTFAVLEQNVGALEATGAPTVSQFQLMFESHEGYWQKSSDNSYVVI